MLKNHYQKQKHEKKLLLKISHFDFREDPDSADFSNDVVLASLLDDTRYFNFGRNIKDLKLSIVFVRLSQNVWLSKGLKYLWSYSKLCFLSICEYYFAYRLAQSDLHNRFACSNKRKRVENLIVKYVKLHRFVVSIHKSYDLVFLIFKLKITTRNF